MGESQPKTWLYGILNNKIAEFYRHRTAHRTVQTDVETMSERMFSETGHWTQGTIPQEWGDEPEHLLDNDDFNRILRECLERLPRHWHLCLTMKYLEGYGPKKACQDLGISTTNYWQILHRTKLQLRQCLELHWFNKQ
jgi:RNA polymerase sigma-70 factor (ECF subfamily)